MGELRSGYAVNILSEIMGLDVPAEAGSAFGLRDWWWRGGRCRDGGGRADAAAWRCR